MHVTFIQAFAVVWAALSLTMLILGMRLACKPLPSHPKPLHIRQAEAIAARCFREKAPER